MKPNKRVLKLTRAALDEFDNGTVPVSALVRKAQRIATLRPDHSVQIWLHMENTDLTTDGQERNNERHQLRENLKTLLGQDEGLQEYMRQYERWEYNHSTKDDTGKTRVYGYSVGQLETELQNYLQAYDSAIVPPNLIDADAGFAHIDSTKTRNILTPAIQKNRLVLEKIRSSVHDFLLRTEAELEHGRSQPTIFDRVQTHINKGLSEYAPDALAEFVESTERLSSGETIHLSHALTSCRRMIKALADALYPATDEDIVGTDGVTRNMNDEKYKNRLNQYVKDKLGKHTSTTVVQKTIDSLSSKLTALDALSGKGVHAKVTRGEAETCVVQTYLIAAELLSIADGSSALITESEPALP